MSRKHRMNTASCNMGQLHSSTTCYHLNLLHIADVHLWRCQRRLAGSLGLRQLSVHWVPWPPVTLTTHKLVLILGGNVHTTRRRTFLVWRRHCNEYIPVSKWHISTIVTLYGVIHVGSHRAKDKLKIQTIHKLNTNQKKTNHVKYSKTKLPWFSRLSRHSASKQGGLILQCSGAHTRPSTL